MNIKQLAIFKEALDKEGLDPESWGSWLENASRTCFALRKTLEATEPYAKSTISMLEEIETTLLSFTDED